MLFPLPMTSTRPAAGRGWPVANAGLILANVAAWMLVDADRAELRPGSGLISLATYGFVHAGLVHLALSMWALWVFGNAVNRRLGNPAYLALYAGSLLFVGLVAKFVTTGSLLGSSGGVLAVTAAAALLLRTERVLFLLVAVFPLTLLLGLFRRPVRASQWFIRWGWFRLRVWWGVVFVPLLIAIGLLVSTDWQASQLVHLVGLAAGLVAVPLIPRHADRGSSRPATTPAASDAVTAGAAGADQPQGSASPRSA